MTRRREAIAAAAVGAGALALPARVRAAIDKELLKKLERVAVARATRGEQTKMVAFEAIANSRVLDPRETATIRVLADHATQHVNVLTTLMKDQLGADAPLAPKRNAIPGLLRLHDAAAALRLAVDLENRAVGDHIAAVRVLHDAQILRAIASIVASDGQHLVLLRQLLHENPVPSAFERGTG